MISCFQNFFFSNLLKGNLSFTNIYEICRLGTGIVNFAILKEGICTIYYFLQMRLLQLRRQFQLRLNEKKLVSLQSLQNIESRPMKIIIKTGEYKPDENR